MKFLLQRAHRSAAAWSFFSTLLRLGANVFVLPVILRKLPQNELGMWYVFGTIGGLASLLDLGFESSITRLTAYAWAGATRFKAFGIHQDGNETAPVQPNLPLLRELIATLKIYYFYAGLAVLIFLAIGGGAWIWLASRHLAGAESIRLAWLVYAAGCVLNFVMGRWPALLTGVGAVREAQQATILSQILYYVIVTAGLLGGLGIWALVLGFVGMGFVARQQGQRFFKRIVALPGGLPRAHLHPEIFHAIWPNAWRTGVVGIGAFLTVYVNTLVCNGYLGLAMTASYGVSFQLIGMLFGLCNVWVAVKLPHINVLRQQGRNDEIAEVFARRVRLMILSYVAGTLVVLFVAPEVLHWMKSKTPLIAIGPLALLALVRLLELHHSAYTMLILSENYNPFMKTSIIFGIATVVVSMILTPLLGVWGVILSMGLVSACFNNWWPILRALRGLGLMPGEFLVHHYLRPKAWLELF